MSEEKDPTLEPAQEPDSTEEISEPENETIPEVKQAKKKFYRNLTIMVPVLLVLLIVGFWFHLTEYKKAKLEHERMMAYKEEAEKRKIEEEKQRKINAEKAAKEAEERKKKEAEAKRLAKQKAEEARKRAEEAKKLAEARKKEVEEAKKAADEKRKLAEIKVENARLEIIKKETERKKLIQENIKNYSGDLTTKEGVVYKNVKIIRTTKKGVDITHSSGGAFVKFKDMDPELRKKLMYRPSKEYLNAVKKND